MTKPIEPWRQRKIADKDGNITEKFSQWLELLRKGVNEAMSVRDFYFEVANGNVPGHEIWNKFGYNANIPNSGAYETVWANSNLFVPMASADTLDLVSTSANDAAAGTGFQTAVVYGIDANWDAQIEVIALNGTTAVTTTKTWLGVNRVACFLFGSAGTNVGTITVDTNTGANRQAIVPAGGGVTQQCIFFVPRNSVFNAQWLFINGLKTSGGATPTVQIRGQVYSDVNKGVQEIFRMGLDTGIENTQSIDPVPLSFPVAEKSILYFEANSDQNNTELNMRFSGILKTTP